MYSRVYVEITNQCNMHCSFCHGHSRAPRKMSEGEFAHVLSELAGKTEYIYYHLMGEPLSHPLLPRFIGMAGARGFRSVLTTNGTLLPACGQELLRAGVYKVNVSLHSFEAGGADAEERYLAGVCDFLDAARDAGVLCVLRLWNAGCDGGRNAHILSYLRERLVGEWAEGKRGFRIRHRLHLEWGERFSWPDMGAPVCSERVFCHALSDHFGVLSDGTVVPCCLDAEGALSLGNLFDAPLDEILASPRAEGMLRSFRNRGGNEELCRRCGYATRFL